MPRHTRRFGKDPCPDCGRVVANACDAGDIHPRGHLDANGVRCSGSDVVTGRWRQPAPAKTAARRAA